MLKPTFESLRTLAGQSFIVRRFNEKAFTAPYHYHPELELTFIEKGRGNRYVGNNMSPYSEGDIVLLGAHLPHCWKLEKPRMKAASVVLQFKPDCLGDSFFEKNEMRSIKKLIHNSGYGIQFLQSAATTAGSWLPALEKEQHSFRKIIGFLEILHLLAESNHYILLNKEKDQPSDATTDQNRINNVMAYIVEHFRQQPTLEKAASIAGMTPTAFCKYFKQATRKTFIETVTEYRINYAMQQLVSSDQPITNISFESGFGDVSHFYKTFKQKKKTSPLQYRNKFRKDLATE